MNVPSSSAHRLTWDLIPWLVNGTASVQDRAFAEDHLAACIDCRDEYAFQSLLQAGLRVDAPVATDAQASLRQLLNHIDSTQAEDAAVVGDPKRAFAFRPSPRRNRRAGVRRMQRTFAALLLAQTAALALFGVLLLRHGAGTAEEGAYRTLGRSTVTSIATIRLVPAPALTLGALRSLLDAAGVEIVDSNDDGSIYGLALRESSRTGAVTQTGERDRTLRAVARLRAQPGVLLAEPIGAAAGGGH